MKITHRGPADADLSKLINADKPVNPSRTDADAAVKQGGASAKVEISKEGRELQRIADLVRKGDDLRADKVKLIKDQIEQGQYHADAEEVSKSILRSEVARLLDKNNKE